MTVSTSVATANEVDLLASSRQRLSELTSRLESVRDAAGKARLLLDVGRHDEARALVPELLAGDLETPEPSSEGALQAAAILFEVHDYESLSPLVEALTRSPEEPPGTRRTAYRWWFLIDDLERVERALEERRSSGEIRLADRLARARLHVLLLEREAAQRSYEAALAEAGTGEEKAWALHGLGVALHHRLDFDGALARLTEALEETPLDPDLLTSLCITLIRLSRTDEAIDALELAVRLAPYHERAHYFLGNGYARKSYAQLFDAYPAAFADEEGRTALRRAEELVASGHVETARALLQELRRARPEWADLASHQGSLAFAERRYGDARRLFVEALGLCPEYGRAHNGLARAIEAEQSRYSVHRETYEGRFAAQPMPQVRGIEDYVANWASLEPRHRKQVALSVVPWARYVPVLLEAGSTHYIKPLHQLLSESPEMEHLADERISYDSRLWDDVRGVGGHHTVTGVEDVEQIPWNGYNTVLHELTHQVHQLLPSDDRRRIQELYRKTKVRDEKSAGEVFLSRYAGCSVWEYFAEGANSLESPRRDRFDTREIVRERLEEKDPELLRLVRELMDKSDLAGAFTVALVNRGSQHLRWGRAEEAIAALQKALERTPDSEEAADSLSYALSVAGHPEQALELAEEKARAQPESAALALAHASALWLSGRGLETARGALVAARECVREDELYLVDQRLGSWAWTAGDAAAARQAYESVLAYQAAHPQGLWGLASSYALAGDWDEAWKRYDEAVRHRTGVVGLRVGYAWDLLRAGELVRARAQLDAALLLDPDDPELLALEALWLLEGTRLEDTRLDGTRPEGARPEEAAAKAARALEVGPWSDTARWARARSLIRLGRGAEGRKVLAALEERIQEQAPPEYVYRPEKGSYVLVHTLPAVLREELAGSGGG